MSRAKRIDRQQKPAATREDWITMALVMLRERGVDGIKVVTIAKRLGLTSGSFYWHFENVQDLLNEVLSYWEHHLTDDIITAARNFSGPPEERILDLMLQVIQEDATMYDQAIAVWANSNKAARTVYRRTIKKRFQFAQWMFEQVGFPEDDARTRGRLFVTALMGESSSNLKADPQWEQIIKREHALLTARH